MDLRWRHAGAAPTMRGMSTLPSRRELLGCSAALAGLLASLSLLPAPAQAAWNEAA